MEDDEEYSYSGYSEKTAEDLTAGGFVDNDEVFSYSGYSEETAAATEHAEAGFYGDFLVEEFSAESAVDKVAKVTHISADTVSNVLAALYFVFGIACVVLTVIFTYVLDYTSYIKMIFAYIVGGAMILIGLVRLISAIRRREYKDTHTNATASSLIFIALGIMIVLETEWAITFIAIAWGIFGLLEGAHAFNHAFSRISRGQNPWYYLIKGGIEVVLAFMLLWEPEHHITMHIIVLGINMIFDSVTMLPAVKRLVHSKK